MTRQTSNIADKPNTNFAKASEEYVLARPMVEQALSPVETKSSSLASKFAYGQAFTPK